ncbi:MAG: anaerobic benzoate catabolism transcriptional regulator [Planctomycetota bacterium]|nr:anaerobic benzoate catabolism transcriptional regulator [Planctomycetota bacterium]
MTSLAQRIRQLRFTKGWGPEDLAERASISRTALYQIEAGKTGVPRASTLRRLARALGVDPEDLLQGTGDEEMGSGSKHMAVLATDEPQGENGATAEAHKTAVLVPQAAPAGVDFLPPWLQDLQTEKKLRILLHSPLREAIVRIVEGSFQLLPPELRDLAI